MGSAALAVGSMLLGLVSLAPVAYADQTGTVSTNADPLWQTDGRVDAVAYNADGSDVFIAGTFHHLCPPTETTCDGTSGQDIAIDNLAALNASDGTPITSWRPQPNGEVLSLAFGSNQVLYAGGLFTVVGGQKHRKLAALNAVDGSAIGAWKPVVNAAVKAIALSASGNFVYFGGSFTTVNGATRHRLAALTTASGTASAVLQPWAPEPSGTNTVDKGVTVPSSVNSLAVGVDGAVYAGGIFTIIGGLERHNVAALGQADGQGSGAAVPGFTLAPTLDYVVLTVSLTGDGSTLFVNGRGPGGFVWGVDAVTGTRIWYRHFDGDVQAAVATDTRIYIGGHFDYIAITGTSLRDQRHHLAALDTVTGATDPWNPTANSVFGVYGMAWSSGHIAAGGDFTKINNVAHEGIAQFSGGDSVAPAAVTDLVASSSVKGRVDLTWSAVADSDSPSLTYEVYRRLSGGTFTVLARVPGPNATSASGPVTYSDSTGAIGPTYDYTVRATDPVYRSPLGNIVTKQVVGDQAPPGTPTGVTATTPSDGNIDVTWTGGGDGDDSTLTYAVSRNNGTSTTAVGSVSGSSTGTTTFRDTSSSGGTFTYTVTASDGTFTSNSSSPSSPVVVAADGSAPAVPSNVAATSPSANLVAVTWSASSDTDQSAGQLSYLISRKLSSASGTGTVIATVGGGQTSFTDTTASPDKSYTYYVAASDGPNTSAKSAGTAVTVSSAIFSDDMSSLSTWTLPPTKSNGVSLDTNFGAAAPPSFLLSGVRSTKILGYAHRGFGGSGYRTVCAKESVSVSSFDTTSTGETTLIRMFSTTGNDIARVYLDRKGQFWIRSDWGSSPNLTHVTVAADGAWHTVQLCVTSTPAGEDGSMTAYFDGTKYGPITSVDNSVDPLGSLDIGERGLDTFSIHVDDVSVGTTPR
jgi:fibronectin type 3 domain-containing protein